MSRSDAARRARMDDYITELITDALPPTAVVDLPSLRHDMFETLGAISTATPQSRPQSRQPPSAVAKRDVSRSDQCRSLIDRLSSHRLHTSSSSLSDRLHTPARRRFRIEPLPPPAQANPSRAAAGRAEAPPRHSQPNLNTAVREKATSRYYVTDHERINQWVSGEGIMEAGSWEGTRVEPGAHGEWMQGGSWVGVLASSSFADVSCRTSGRVASSPALGMGSGPRSSGMLSGPRDGMSSHVRSGQVASSPRLAMGGSEGTGYRELAMGGCLSDGSLPTPSNDGHGHSLIYALPPTSHPPPPTSHPPPLATRASTTAPPAHASNGSYLTGATGQGPGASYPTTGYLKYDLYPASYILHPPPKPLPASGQHVRPR